jgi:hypothetical protein
VGVVLFVSLFLFAIREILYNIFALLLRITGIYKFYCAFRSISVWNTRLVCLYLAIYFDLT